jgi:phospholipid/cholesterol/gamma-HCH transport system permease protein
VTPGRPARHDFGWVARLGLAAVTLKLCLELYVGILAGRARLDLPALAAALRQSGLSVLPALTLVAVAVGLILGRQAAQLLAEIDLPALILAPVSYALVVELMPLLVGILVAGRAGVALAARQAMLVASGQVDGLIVCGLNPIQYTTGPVLLAMLVMSFAFVVWGSLVTFAAVAAWMVLLAGVPLAELTDALRQALAPGDLAEALIKPQVFALAVALIATVNGTAAGRDVEGISSAATATMIGAVTAILLIDLGFVLAPWF